MKKILLSMLVVLMATGCTFTLNGKTEEEKKNDVVEEKENEKGQDISTGNELVTIFEYRTHFVNDYFTGEDLFGYFYTQDKITLDTISNQAKLFLSIRSLYGSTWDKGVGNVIEVPKADVENAFELLFGSKATYQDEDLKGSACNFAGFKYDSSKQVYTQDAQGCGGTAVPKYETKVISATKYSDKFEFTEKVAYVAYDNGEEKVYKSKDDKTALGNGVGDNITAYYDKLDSYKWTFYYDNDKGHYYFYSVEKVK
jgi:lipoprotein